MKAVIWTKYGPPEGLVPGEMEKPVPGDDDILVGIRAASVTAGDCEFRRLKLPLSLSLPMRLYAGWKKPQRLRVLGQELSGVVVEKGKNVSGFNVGDEVFGTTGMGFGAYSEYIRLPGEPGDAQGILIVKPDSLSFEEAAVVPTAGMEALHYISRSQLSKGQKVLIIGAGGSIGSLALQMAKLKDAEVTVVDSSEKLPMLGGLGADHLIDYTKENYLRTGDTFDLIIDVVGKRSVFSRIKLLKRGGYYFLAYAGVRHLFMGIWTSLFMGRKLRIESSEQTREEMTELKKLLDEGKLKPVIDKQYPLEEAAEAHRYADSGKKKGNIVLSVRT